MSSATVLDEFSVPNWRMNGQFRYDIAMNTIIVILITDAVLHMTLRAHKIPLNDNVEGLLYTFSFAYALFIILTYVLWATEDERCLPTIYIMGRLGHTLAMFAPCCPCLWRGEPAWWNFVKQPQPTVDIV
ncbi:hypothetical protein HA466_0254040 [Hirschfeldia incana]|nr:hypothetical protein HA466_0254040 [Hirschfeldia incana]